MIRRDYILRMIKEFIRALAGIKGLKSKAQWEEAAAAVDQEFNKLIGAGAPVVAQFSETELLARLLQGEPTQAVRDKILMLTALLREAGDAAAAQGRVEESRACYLKGLHLLLDALGRGEVFECPDFVPTVEIFAAALADAPLPARTNALLMQHYERLGEFAKAEDALFAMLDTEPSNAGMVEFGLAFYGRLRRQSDASLLAGNLPRHELEAGLAELRERQATLSSTCPRQS